ncbi:outer membrane beta-barrel protein [Pedobacter frigoris]|uniref:type IX secretion/gliding motility protein PorT/SprT n=1 Tax=Pedobacter frigoris TaxID=2571272 RepID=UPI0029313FF4|nr:outer membrane beta-barrel protein [Pedobacter frigoris]
MKLKSALLLLCLFVSVSLKAQNWGGGVDDDNIHFGFTFQYLSSEYKILKKSDWRNPYPDVDPTVMTSPLIAISSKPSAGFGIGFVVNKRISENADVRFTPILVFNDRIMSYQFTESKFDIEKKVQSTLVEFPLGLKIKSNRRNNFRAYILGGAKYSTDISSKKKTNNDLVTDPAEKFLNNKRSFISYETGLGFDLYFEYFKMSPELKLSYSLNSVLKDEPNRYAAPIDKLMLRHVTFSLFFE